MTSKNNLFFSGFSFCNETELFLDYIDNSPFVLSGFSFGAIKAFEYALNCKERVDKIQLFSPAFFQTKELSFKKMQLLYYKKDKNRYTDEFLKNVVFPSEFDLKKYTCDSTYEELEQLLFYEWQEDKIKKLLKKGTKIEVYLGKLDKIIQAQNALGFFKPFATVYFYNNYGHLLKGNTIDEKN
ncbi:MAG: hypothetical protein QG567_521 [Campylobacterota bacterium]|nr:hypothetical protein [Campylobacterota bacterium]